MNLKGFVKPGDLLFDSGNGLMSRLIKKFTFGVTNHVGIIYDESTIFETDGKYKKAQFHPLDKYTDRSVLIIRLKELEDYSKIKELCTQYNGTPYSYWDIVTNALFSPLKDEVREWLVEKVGTKKFMICSELSSRILYEATNLTELSEYEGLTPQDLLKICLFHPTQWEIVYQSPEFQTL